MGEKRALLSSHHRQLLWSLTDSLGAGQALVCDVVSRQGRGGQWQQCKQRHKWPLRLGKGTEGLEDKGGEGEIRRKR